MKYRRFIFNTEYILIRRRQTYFPNSASFVFEIFSSFKNPKICKEFILICPNFIVICFIKSLSILGSHKWAICGWFWDSFSHFTGVHFYFDISIGIPSFKWTKRKEFLIFMWFFMLVNALEMIIIANRQLFFDWSHIFI